MDFLNALLGGGRGGSGGAPGPASSATSGVNFGPTGLNQIILYVAGGVALLVLVIVLLRN